jgi:leader peptidase (prepilin peptidase)/N-methyltransferase
MFDPKIWALVPFQFWTLCVFVFGCVAGSFLNVCIYRMPREESIVRPPSHCPNCGYCIPWRLNIPLLTWLWLRGQCANCQAPISARYFLVELLTGLAFAGCWIHFGHLHPLLAWFIVS